MSDELEFSTDRTVRQHVDTIIEKAKELGDGETTRQLVLNVWIGKARAAGIDPQLRKDVVTLVEAEEL